MQTTLSSEREELSKIREDRGEYIGVSKIDVTLYIYNLLEGVLPKLYNCFAFFLFFLGC